MQFENVCKFNYNHSSDLICLNFIYEIESPRGPYTAGRNGIFLVSEGSGILTCNQKRWSIDRGCVFFVREMDRYLIESVSDLKYYYINFQGRRGEEFLERIGVGENRRIFRADEDLIEFWRKCHQSADDTNIDILCETVFLYAIAVLKPEKKEQHDVVTKVVTLTNKKYSDPSLSISSIATQLGYDAKYLSSLFKKRMGVGYTQYLRELRLRHAVFLIEQGLVSVKNIALLCGFSDALYFSRLFTQSEGMSPKAYIDKMGEREMSDGSGILPYLICD